MRRFLLTIPAKFKGAIEVIYNGEGLIRNIDFSKVNLQPEVLNWFKKGVPVIVENMLQYEQATGVVVNEAEFEVTFEEWIRVYGYKRNTHLAREYWDKVSVSDRYMALTEGYEYKEYCERQKSWYKPMLPDKWLRTRQYLNNWKEL